MVFDAQGTETLRRRGTALYHFQLLPPPATAGTARARNLFLKELARKSTDFFVGYVLMLNHVHLLISEPKGHCRRYCKC